MINFAVSSGGRGSLSNQMLKIRTDEAPPFKNFEEKMSHPKITNVAQVSVIKKVSHVSLFAKSLVSEG